MNVVNLIKLAVALSATALLVIVLLLFGAGARIGLDIVYGFALMAVLTWTICLIPRTWWS